MSAPTTTNPVSSSPKRSWRRFTLRGLFLVVLAASIFCGWVAHHARMLQRRYEWIQGLQAKHFNGPTVEPVKNQWFWRPLVGDAAVSIKRLVLNGYNSGTRQFDLTPEDVEQLKTCIEAEQLLLAGPAITDENIKFIRNFHELTLLGLENTGIADAGAAWLANLHQLRELDIYTHSYRAAVPGASITEVSLKHLVVGKDLDTLALGAPISDDGLSLIVEYCPNLRRLQLFGSRITANGLPLLARLTNLDDLRIDDNFLMDDAAITRLPVLSRLKSLSLRETAVTEQGWRAIQEKMPGVMVHLSLPKY
jgi:hypothetical protein